MTGLVESSGSFTFSRSGTRRQNFSLFFGVKLSGSEGALLDRIQQFFGAGSIYDVGERGRYFRVANLDELESVIAHFEQYPLLGPKRASYEIWREMVQLKKSSFRKPPFEELVALAARLSAASKRRR